MRMRVLLWCCCGAQRHPVADATLHKMAARTTPFTHTAVGVWSHYGLSSNSSMVTINMPEPTLPVIAGKRCNSHDSNGATAAAADASTPTVVASPRKQHDHEQLMVECIAHNTEDRRVLEQRMSETAIEACD